jgi:integral membrane protein (TIGR01906 family)
MKRGIAYLLSTLASLLLIIAILFTCLQISVNNEEWFYAEYAKLGTGRLIGMSSKDIVNSMMRLIDYMEGRVPDISVEVEYNGKTYEMFNEKESLHMVDVRTLYQSFRSIRTFGAMAAVLMLILASLAVRRDTLKVFSRGFLAAGSIFALFAVILGLWVLIDFASFWTEFHMMFFTNNLWLLDPSVDRMILICPEQLFYDIVTRFGGWFLTVMAVLAAASAVYLSVLKRRHNTPLILEKKK